MAKDDPLRSKLVSLATASQGRVTFNVRTSRELGTEFDVDQDMGYLGFVTSRRVLRAHAAVARLHQLLEQERR